MCTELRIQQKHLHSCPGAALECCHQPCAPDPACRHLGYLHPGEYFGEYSCLLGQERSATVVASSYVELYSLSRADLEVVLQQWPELAEQFEAMGEWLGGDMRHLNCILV